MKKIKYYQWRLVVKSSRKIMMIYDNDNVNVLGTSIIWQVK